MQNKTLLSEKELRNNVKAFMLTQYERYGCISEKDYKQMIIDEFIKKDEVTISEYNSYLAESGYETYMDDYELEEVLKSMDVMEAVRCTQYGNFNMMEDYHKFNGYSNIDSFNDYQVMQEMKNDDDFWMWYLEENDLIDEEEMKENINQSMQLVVRFGY